MVTSLPAALAASALFVVPAHAGDPPQEGVGIAVAVGGVQETAENQQGYGVTGDCKVTGTLLPNATLDLSIVARGIATAPLGTVADLTEVYCTVSNTKGNEAKIGFAMGGPVTAASGRANGFSPTGLTVCMQSRASFYPAGYVLDTGTVCAPVVTIAA